MVDGSNESLEHADQEYDPILRKGITLQNSFEKVDVRKYDTMMIRVVQFSKITLKRLWGAHTMAFQAQICLNIVFCRHKQVQPNVKVATALQENPT